MANSFAELEKEIQAKMRTAMQEVRTKNWNDLRDEVLAFYSQGSPKLYVRTGALANSPHVSEVVGGGNFLSFDQQLLYPAVSAFNRERFLKQGWGSNFDGNKVLYATEFGTSGVLGKGGFWERSNEKVQDNINNAFHNAGFK